MTITANKLSTQSFTEYVLFALFFGRIALTGDRENVVNTYGHSPSFTMTNQMRKVNTSASVSLNASDAPSFSISGDTIGSSLLPSPSN